MKIDVYVVGLMFVLTSCSDFLEPKSESEFVPKDAIALNEMLIGDAYAGPGASNYLNVLLPMLDDDMCCSGLPFPMYSSDFNPSGIEGYRALFAWQPNMFYTLGEYYLFFNVWQVHYNLVMGANAALDYVDGVQGTFEEKTIVKAQAYALRAFYFFNLVNMFGEPYNYNKQALGIPLKTTSALEAENLPRGTVEGTYKQIVNDLNEAERLYLSLPGEMQFREDYRVNLPMVQLLKSRVFLYMENWEEAVHYAGKVIHDWTFELLDLNDILSGMTKKEPYFHFNSYSSGETIWLYGGVGPELKYTQATLQEPGESGVSRYKFNASPELLQGYMEGDLRKDCYIVKEYKDDKNNPSKSGPYQPFVYLPFAKVRTNSIHLPLTGEGFARAFRLAEAYLNLAEGAAMLDDPGTAREMLNQLRQNRFTRESYVPMPALTGDDLIEYIRQERRLELCYEGFRWFDLRRYGMPSFSRVWMDKGVALQLYTIQKNDPSYTLPIPEQVMTKNKKLVQNKLANPR